MHTMKSITCSLLAALISASANAASSYPVLQCVNESAKKDECVQEYKDAVSHIQSWFNPYINSKRRHLLDCQRFCDPAIQYFSFQLPCSCQNHRMLTEETEPASERGLNLDTQYLEGPVQLFYAYATGMPDGPCKDVFSRSVCVVSFVTEYDFTKANMEQDNAEKDQYKVSYDAHNAQAIDLNALKPVDSQVYDPSTGQTHHYDSNGQEIP
jgi:hypothetical protein